MYRELIKDFLENNCIYNYLNVDVYNVDEKGSSVEVTFYYGENLESKREGYRIELLELMLFIYEKNLKS